MLNFTNRIIQYGLDKFFSFYECYQCKEKLRFNDILCSKCFKEIVDLTTRSFVLNNQYTMPVFSSGLYHEPLRTLVLLKHAKNKNASIGLAKILWKTKLKDLDFDAIVPIPLHWTRYSKRWFNQAQEMAQEISRLSGKPTICAIERIKKTEFQSGLTFQERSENVNSSIFELTQGSEICKDKNILIIDDLLTTGTTLCSAAKKIILLKPKSIIGATGARTL